MVIERNKIFIGAISASLISSAALWEGTKYYAYKDIAGVPTVCSGYTGKGIVFGKKYSQEECREFLHKELVTHSNGVLNCITQPLLPNVHDAFTLMTYNIGVSGFCGSNAARLYNQGYYKEACYAIYKTSSGTPVWSYITVNGDKQFVQGLYNRRKYEAAMCLGDPSAKLD